jgi:ABC-2 type transport system ATP-binding protein
MIGGGAVAVATPVIETRGLVKRFADANAVDAIDLLVPAGGVYGFLGPNGAGKTTTIRILVGLLWPTGGGARIFGEPVTPGASVLRRVGSLIERPAFYPYLSARENLRVFGTAHGLGPDILAARATESLDRVGLASVAGRRAGGFSTGMRQRLALAIALLGRPDLVILDEPTNGLDPNGVIDVRELIASLARDGITVFLSSHVLPEVEQLCARVAILREGRIVAEGPTTSLLAGDEQILVRFDTVAQADQALAVLAGGDDGGASVSRPVAVARRGDRSDTIHLDAAATDASAINRRLADAGLWPAELRIQRESLETVFRELTAGPETTHADAAPRPSLAAAGSER